MRILIVGNGGRESALAMKLKDDKRVTQMYFAKGNATTQALGKTVHETDIKYLRDFAIKEKIDLTIVGPEAPLVDGLVDEFKKFDLKVFGPNQKAASLEGSKAFSKKFMQKHGVKTAVAKVFDAYGEAKEYLKNKNYPLVIKASGLAGGKGVVICEDYDEALATLDDFMIRRIYGDAGIRVVIEEYLRGFEASIIAFSNGQELFPCIPVKDYKKVGNGDKGANTGGMGSVAPSPEFTEAHMEDFRKNILNPTMQGLKADELEFKGFIFFGLMVTADGCYCLEYNMRLGDPETQVIMPLLESNLVDVIEDCLEGKEIELKFRDEKAVCLVMCSGGYPRNIETGYEITGLDKVAHSQVLFAGATRQGERVITNGGRVVNFVATAPTYEEARKKVYADAHTVNFDYAFYRDDIAKF
ncbi:phosphoribosylamine--glycine ligase [Riemerella anatipestifer]|nr:phosphoribosylamine--glycine ligase [Riemerella anatipestifer]MDY3532307.1 phosphoribosylamine--glycine ligase [Riemerella anatipestifer]MDY3535138.1 phosphoribosylamine--glycine ligase [Riemerella anatipestifer]